MAYLDDIQNWIFAGTAAARRINAQVEWEEWFEEDTILSIEPVLDSTERYIDVGGTSYAPLAVIFAFPDVEARATFMGKRSTSGQLERLGYNPKSRFAVLRRCQELASTNDGYALLSCTFEAL